MTKLCDGSNKNIITVFGHGIFGDSSYAYIDMELCDFNLDDYNKWKKLVVQVEGSPGDNRHIWSVMTQITNGLCYIHNNREIHRDLKPSNGTRGFSNYC